MKKEHIFIYIASLLVVSIGIITISGMNILRSDKYHKNYIIDNSSSIEKSDENSFYIENIEGYYDQISIHLTSDSSYHIIIWGDRNHFMWPLLKDKQIEASIPYDRYYHRDVKTDIKLIESLNSI